MAPDSMMPMRGIFAADCCARAVSDHAVAPPSSVTNSRRLSRSNCISLHIGWIIDFLARNRLPGMYQVKENVVAGGLMSYGASLPDLSRGAAGYVHKILQGTRPADLPVEQPTKFDLAVNLKTAKALGLTIPEPFLLLADEIIE
jgi:ABC-type uncharacterized transport system substrate-binding protein